MIAVLLANGFEEIEALTPVDILRRAGLEVKTVAITGDDATGSHGINVACDLRANELDIDSVNCVIFPGGMPGATNLDASPYTDSILASVTRSNGLIAAICAAPLILGRRGLLNGKKATCYPGFESELVGATIMDEGVVTDGRIVTARGMGVALDFSLELVRLLVSEEKADDISSAICK